MAESRAQGYGPSDPAGWAWVFEAIPFPIYAADIDSYEVVGTNRLMQDRVGDVVGRKCYEAIYQQPHPCQFCRIGALTACPPPTGNRIVFEHFNDVDERWYQLVETLIDWFDGRRVKYSLAIDISALKETQNALAAAHAQLALNAREIETASSTDPLTGLLNRWRLLDVAVSEVARAARYGRPLSVIMTDVDGFKSINDRFGHQAGDAVLQQLAALLLAGVRQVDIVGRWAGEAFVMICPDTDLAGATAMAEKLRALVEAHGFPAVGRATCSFGVAAHRPAERFDALVARAHAALSRAKAAGRNRVDAADRS